jgi:hypothetical protein
MVLSLFCFGNSGWTVCYPRVWFPQLCVPSHRVFVWHHACLIFITNNSWSAYSRYFGFCFCTLVFYPRYPDYNKFRQEEVPLHFSLLLATPEAGEPSCRRSNHQTDRSCPHIKTPEWNGFEAVFASTRVKTLEPIHTFPEPPPDHCQQQTDGFTGQFGGVSLMICSYPFC